MHRWGSYRGIKWPVCMWCGLVALKNETTARLMRRRCPGDE